MQQLLHYHCYLVYVVVHLWCTFWIYAHIIIIFHSQLQNTNAVLHMYIHLTDAQHMWQSCKMIVQLIYKHPHVIISHLFHTPILTPPPLRPPPPHVNNTYKCVWLMLAMPPLRAHRHPNINLYTMFMANPSGEAATI